MLLRTSIVALAIGMAAPMTAQAQVLDFGAGGPQLDLRSKKQRQKDSYRDQMGREQYRQSYGQRERRDGYRERDRDLTTGSVRRYDDRSGYERRRSYDGSRW